jgi:hypothetical protein
MSTPYPPTTTSAPQRTELLHHLLVRASAGLVARRHDRNGHTVFVAGEAAPMPYALAVSCFASLGWLVWYRDVDPHDPAAWWSCHLTPEGEAVLAVWDAQLRRVATA